MNEKALESFIDMCDEMMVPTQEGFGMSVKNVVLNAKNRISELIRILLDKIRSLREFIRTNVYCSVNIVLYNKLVKLSNGYQQVLVHYMPYITCKKQFTSEAKKEYEEDVTPNILDELNKIPKIVIKAESLIPMADSKAKQAFKTITDITNQYEATAKGLDGVLGRMEGTIAQLTNASAAASNAKAIGGPALNKDDVNDTIRVAQRHIWLLQDTITIMNKFISAFRKTIGTTAKPVKKGSGANTSFA